MMNEVQLAVLANQMYRAMPRRGQPLRSPPRRTQQPPTLLRLTWQRRARPHRSPPLRAPPPSPTVDENGFETIDLHAVGWDDSNANEPMRNADVDPIDWPLGQAEDEQRQRPPAQKIGYVGTMMNFFKGNIGTGCFAMGNAFRNAGLLIGSIMTVVIGLVCLHCQHILLQCAEMMEKKRAQDLEQQGIPAIEDRSQPNLPEMVEYCFRNGPAPFRPWTTTMRRIIITVICVMQIGYCCVYFIFVASNMKQIADQYVMNVATETHFALLLILLIPLCIITKMKYLTPFSALANLLMALGIGITIFYAIKDPLSTTDVAERKLIATVQRMPVFFSTVIFAFEGIPLVLPLRNGMRRPADFGRPCGVLNVGTVIIILLYTVLGIAGYLRWGEDVQGSMTLNLPVGELLAEVVKVSIAASVLLGFGIQLFVAVEIMWPVVQSYFLIAKKYPISCEMIFRILLVLMIFVIGLFMPNLDFFISIIGAVCSTSLGLMFPAIIDLIISYSAPNVRPSVWKLAKNIFILLLAVLGLATGTYGSIKDIMN